MKNIKSLEERIVNLTKRTAEGISGTEEAELRHLYMNGTEPRSIKVVLAKTGFGAQLDLLWDESIRGFATTIGGITWTSNFDWKDYVATPWESGKYYVRSSRRK